VTVGVTELPGMHGVIMLTQRKNASKPCRINMWYKAHQSASLLVLIAQPCLALRTGCC